MRQKSQTRLTGAAKVIKDIRRATRKQYSAEEKIRIVLDVFLQHTFPVTLNTGQLIGLNQE